MIKVFDMQKIPAKRKTEGLEMKRKEKTHFLLLSQGDNLLRVEEVRYKYSSR